ncbi:MULTISPECIES: MBOAT family O-acyltransferase [unclassified Coleofasciculus]|uniref:MBOAT family O-acyltransferase n=1 Tax=unclassified Coleofasciculus TaxID=2692782 RepID=UPI001880C5B5|nr:MULTISPECIES: MBOAT family protein [unclassified Coleofasciculus]MBE9125801.1 MBOAT family protein [Coleofasciculus sp. LEGE 07081]MBE9149014.1 MBOAT family protein [Coleofasciculus sp. LEGE 07092]
MNFSDFSFWWVLLLYCIPFFTIRYIGKSLKLWRDYFDTVGLTVMSLLLFVNASRSSFLIFAAELVFNYFMVRQMQQRRGAQAKLIAAVVIIIDIGILAYLKYLTFFVEDVIGLAVGSPMNNWHDNFPLPIFPQIPPGVSFYTFQMVAFVVDSLKPKYKKPIGFIDYINFISFFPQIVAGPIERRADLLPQIQAFRFKFTVENFEEGLRWLSLGFFMKLVLADNLAPYINLQETANAWMVWFFAYLFTLRIYFDFAGYSFMALGVARILGIRLTINFLAPYTSVSIQEFWRRWHITLNNWFRDYVFLPLMGSKKQWAAFFLFITFTLSGFWHGAAWNFIIWGAYHGALLLLLRYTGRPFQRLMGNYASRSQFISWALTFGAVTLGCLFFMEINISRLLLKIQTIVTPWAYSFSNLGDFLSSYSFNEGAALIFTLVLANGVLFMEHLAVWQKRKLEYELLLSPWVSRILLGLTILLAANEPSKFIYFEF